jgi:hypothetical protein
VRELTRMRREDFAAAVAAHRLEANSLREWGPFGFALVAALALMVVGARNATEIQSSAMVLGGWAIIAGLNALMLRRYRARVVRHGLVCPECFKPLVQFIEPHGRKRADRVLASGRCPGCGTNVLAPGA